MLLCSLRNSWFFLFAALFFLGNYVKGYGCQKDKSFYGFLPVCVDSHDGHSVVQDTHEDGTDYYSGYGSDSTVCGSSTDEAGTDRIHFIVCSGCRCCGIETGDADKSCDCRKHCHVDISDEVYAVCLDTTEFCCIFVTADCVVVTAGNGFGCVVSISCYDYGKKNEDCRQTFVAVQFDADKHNHCGNDDTSCDIAVKIALLISVFLCFNSFPEAI